MKVVIEFDLSNPEDVEKKAVYDQCEDMYWVLTHIADVYRSVRKYDGDPMTEEEFYESLQLNNVNLDILP